MRIDEVCGLVVGDDSDTLALGQIMLSESTHCGGLSRRPKNPPIMM